MTTTRYERVEALLHELRNQAHDEVTKQIAPDATQAYENALGLVEQALPRIISEVFRAGARVGNPNLVT
jgi:hypothetical protein